MIAVWRATVRAVCVGAILSVIGCAPAPEGRIAPAYKPNLATDEGGLWDEMDKSEAKIRDSRSLIRDAELNAYLQGIVCRLTPDHCADIRIYIIRTPAFNASAAPNGMLQIWTGSLLRVQNEAQLAAVIGHELGHYLRRHGLQIWRDARAKSDFGAFLAIGLAAGGVGLAAGPANMLLLASIYGFNRDQEREADAIGLELMTKAGYRPMEASRVWDQIVAEDKADKNHKDHDFFFSTHPASEERAATLRKQAEQSGDQGEVGVASFQEHLKGIRGMLLDDELRIRQYDRTLVVLQALSIQSAEDGEITFYTGEVYRLRDADGDRQRAHDAYERALSSKTFPPELYRSLGLLELKEGDRDQAEAAFRKYLELRPDSRDRDMIRSYLRSQG